MALATLNSVPGKVVPGFAEPGWPGAASVPPGPTVLWRLYSPRPSQMSALSTLYEIIPVRSTSLGQPYNPTADTVQMAFVTGWSEPSPGQWNPGSWAGTASVNSVWAAQCLVGPANGGVILTVGTYNVWVKLTDSPEVPVQMAGTLTIIP